MTAFRPRRTARRHRIRRRAPLCGKRDAVVQQIDIDCPERHRHEIGDAAVAIHHQSQGRRLYPAHRQHALIARLPAEQGEQPTHVHPDQPVRPGAPQCRVIQAEGFSARFQRRQRLANRGFVQRRQPQAADRPAIAAMLDQLPGDHFALAVGVGGDDQLAGLAEQALDRLVLAGGTRLDGQFPLVGDDRQVGQHPALVFGVVGVRRRGFQQVADAPGHRDVRSQPAAVAPALGAEHGRNILGLGRFFTEVQPHNHRRRSLPEEAHRMAREVNRGNFYLYECTVLRLPKIT